jgi:hypothetical protein
MSQIDKYHNRGKVLQMEQRSHKGLSAQVDNMTQNKLNVTTGQHTVNHDAQNAKSE